MKRLILSLYILAALACSPAVPAAPASAEIIPGCQWLTDTFPKHYVKERANVRDAPNTNGNILATIDAGSIVYTNEGTRNVEGNPEKWYQVLATKSLPAWSGCSGGYMHPSLVSKTPPSAAAESRWGVFMRATTQSNQAYALAWNYPNAESAMQDASKRCEKKMGIPCTPPRTEPSGWWIPDLVFIFSTSAPDEDIGTVGYEAKAGPYTYKIRGRCILIYVSQDRYQAEVGNSEEELRDYFSRESQWALDYYQTEDALPVFHRIACNDF